MISFMVMGGPRSATTWMANLLTTDNTLCIHDPFLEYTLDQVTQLYIPGKRVGISCTAALLHADWVNGQDCKKVILYRHTDEINASLRKLGMMELQHTKHMQRIDSVKAPIISWLDVFKEPGARSICNYLGVPFDVYRFRELVKMNIQPQWQTLPLDAVAVAQLNTRIALLLGGF